MKKVLLIVAFMMAATCAFADVSGYGRLWSGLADAGACNLIPQRIIPGNYLSFPGEELMVIDADGLARIIIWTNQGFSTAWISEDSVTSDPFLSAFPIKSAKSKTDLFVFMDQDKKVHVYGGEKGKFLEVCGDCVGGGLETYNLLSAGACDPDGDGGDEAALWIEKDGFYSVAIAKFNGKKFSIAGVRDVFIDAGGDSLGFFPSCNGGSSEYYLWRNNGLGAYEMVRLASDEEGVSAQEYIPLDKFGVTGGLVVPGVVAKKKLEFLSMTLFGDHPELTFFHPTAKSKTEKYKVGKEMNLYAVADLNGDGTVELVTADFDCGFEVHGIAKPVAKVNEKIVDWKTNVRQMTGGRVYISARSIAGVTVKTEKDFTILTHGKRKLIIDHRSGTVVNSVPGYEENPQVALSYIKEPKRIFIDPVAAAEYLNFQCKWDYLAGRLDINTGEKR